MTTQTTPVCDEPACPWTSADYDLPGAHGWHRAYHLMNGMNDIGPKPAATPES